MIPQNIEILLCDYFRGTVSETDGHIVEEWISSSEENRNSALQYFRLQQSLDIARMADERNADDAFSRFKLRVRKRRASNTMDKVVRIAAILSIPLVASVLILAMELHDRGEYNPDVKICSATGTTASTVLPDGTKVWLNSNSTLVYPTRFSSERRVRLEGEGYFKVAKDNGRRFIVESMDSEIEALGTEFNVEAYRGPDESLRATLYTGSIALRCPDLQEVVVKPGEQYVYTPGNNELSQKTVNLLSEASWKDGRIILDDTPLGEALRMIGNMYNVEFVVKNQTLLKDCYTGVFTGQRLDIILEHFTRTTGMHFDFVLQNGGAPNPSGRRIVIVN